MSNYNALHQKCDRILSLTNDHISTGSEMSSVDQMFMEPFGNLGDDFLEKLIDKLENSTPDKEEQIMTESHNFEPEKKKTQVLIMEIISKTGKLDNYKDYRK